MPRQLVHREELGRLIVQTNDAITTIDDSHYGVRSTSGNYTFTVTTTKLRLTYSCPDYARHNTKYKHVYAVESCSSVIF